MKNSTSENNCPDCRDFGRRDFLTAAAGAALAGSALPLLSRVAGAAPTAKCAAEQAVAELYGTLDETQRKMMVFPLDSPLRSKVSANWSITKANIGSFSAAQQEIIHKVLKGATSEDGYGRFMQQMKEDWGAVEKYAVAIFGDPTGEKFEFELTGRHLTMRAEGNTLGGGAFGGPIVYGHSKKGNSDQNLFSYQTKRANEVFQALDKEQRVKALLDKSPGQTVTLRKEGEALRGISGKELSADQKELVAAVLRDILSPYRQEDVDEALALIEAGGGIDSLSMSFYKQGDLDEDGVWDIWRLEGPSMVTHFRGAPHVHAYINIAQKA